MYLYSLFVAGKPVSFLLFNLLNVFLFVFIELFFLQLPTKYFCLRPLQSDASSCGYYAGFVYVLFAFRVAQSFWTILRQHPTCRVSVGLAIALRNVLTLSVWRKQICGPSAVLAQRAKHKAKSMDLLLINLANTILSEAHLVHSWTLQAMDEVLSLLNNINLKTCFFFFPLWLMISAQCI